METTQGKVVTAYSALMGLSRKQMNSFAAYKLFRLKKALNPIIEFQSEQETKIVEELGGRVAEGGVIILDDEKRREYVARRQELERLECTVETEKISMRMIEIPELAVADIEALDDFISWKE